MKGQRYRCFILLNMKHAWDMLFQVILGRTNYVMQLFSLHLKFWKENLLKFIRCQKIFGMIEIFSKIHFVSLSGRKVADSACKHCRWAKAKLINTFNSDRQSEVVQKSSVKNQQPNIGLFSRTYLPILVVFVGFAKPDFEAIGFTAWIFKQAQTIHHIVIIHSIQQPYRKGGNVCHSILRQIE